MLFTRRKVVPTIVVFMRLPICECQELSAYEMMATGQLTSVQYRRICEPKIGCCEKYMRKQAFESCMEYKYWGFNDIECRQWVETIVVECRIQCADCKHIGKVNYGQCAWFLQTMGVSAELRRQMCTNSGVIMEKVRCPAACKLEESSCFTEEAKACQYDCSQYQNCYCRKNLGTLQPDYCHGKTIVSGPISKNSDTIHSCDRMPAHCRDHVLGNKCVKYKWCETNMCYVQNVVCSADDAPGFCRNIGSCKPNTGKCIYAAQPDGLKCDDGLYYTDDDQCLDGECVGRIDICKRENITCIPPSPCYAEGLCIPRNGRCVHKHKANGVVCNDGLAYTIDDKCQDGLCIGDKVDSCVENGQCKAMDQCHLPGVCEPKTGLCTNPIVPSDLERPCDDNDPDSWGDICIDGVCVGHGLKEPKLAFVGFGECRDMKGRQMPSLYGDVTHEHSCREFCLKDPQCAGYSYSFPLCRLYGAVRTKAPIGSKWAFAAGDEPPALKIEISTGAYPGRQLTCWKKAPKTNALQDLGILRVSVDDVLSPVDLAVLFALAILCATGPCLYRMYCGRGGSAKVFSLPQASKPKTVEDVLAEPETTEIARLDHSDSGTTQRRGSSRDRGDSEDNVIGKRSSTSSPRAPPLPPPLLRPQAPLPSGPPPSARPNILLGKVPPRSVAPDVIPKQYPYPKTLAVPDPELPAAPRRVEESGCKACENAEAMAPLAAMRASQKVDADLPTWNLHEATSKSSD